MTLETQSNHIFYQLLLHGFASLHTGGSPIRLRVVKDSTRVVLSTPVYKGHNYIPKSVRDTIKKRDNFGGVKLQTKLSVEEEVYLILLHCSESLEHLDRKQFQDILEEFIWIAEEWRKLLEDRGRGDLIHIPVK